MKKYLIGLLIAITLLSGGCSLQDTGANIISLQTNNRRTVTTSDTADKTAMDVAIGNGNLGTPLANPTDGATATSTGGTLPADTYYFKLTSVDYSGGQTLPSDELTCSIGTELSGTSTACVITFTPNTLASSTRLWVSTTSGTYTAYQVATSSTFIATTTGLTTATIPTYNTAFNDVGVAQYLASNKTLTDGQLTSLKTDINGILKVTLSTAISHLLDDIEAYPHGGSYSYIASPAANTVVSSAAAVLMCITVGKASSTATDIIEISDHATDGDGNVVLELTDAPVDTYCPYQYFGTGITVDTAVQEDVTITYYTIN